MVQRSKIVISSHFLAKKVHHQKMYSTFKGKHDNNVVQRDAWNKKGEMLFWFWSS